MSRGISRVHLACPGIGGSVDWDWDGEKMGKLRAPHECKHRGKGPVPGNRLTQKEENESEGGAGRHIKEWFKEWFKE